MRVTLWRTWLLACLFALLAAACTLVTGLGDYEVADGDGDTDTDGDADTDGDGDTDTDVDSDGDGDADTDGDSDGDGGRRCDNPDDCDDDDGCTEDFCDPGLDWGEPMAGCLHEEIWCEDDGFECTEEMCIPLFGCDSMADDEMCFGIGEGRCDPWDDRADPVSGCVLEASCSSDDECDDRDPCNGVESCDPGRGCLPGVDPCDDGASCSIETCTAGAGGMFSCAGSLNHEACPGDLCTIALCQPGRDGAEPSTGCYYEDVVCDSGYTHRCTIGLGPCIEASSGGCAETVGCSPDIDLCCPSLCVGTEDPDCVGCAAEVCGPWVRNGCCPPRCTPESDRDCCHEQPCNVLDGCCPIYCGNDPDCVDTPD